MRRAVLGVLFGCVLRQSVAHPQPRPVAPRDAGIGTIQALSTPVERALRDAREHNRNGRAAEAVAALNRLRGRDRARPEVLAESAIARFGALGIPLEPDGARASTPAARRELAALTAALTRHTAQREDGLALLTLGRARLVVGDLAGADAALDAATRVDPEPEAWNDRAMVLVALRRLPEAERCLDEATRRAPRDADPWSNLGAVRLARGEAARAVEAFRRAVELDPSRPRFHSDLGSALLASSETDAAIASYERALALAPTDAVVLANLGYALSLANRLDDALAALRRAVSLAPQSVTAWNNLGTVLSRRGERDEARECFQRAMRLDPSDPRARANLAGLDGAR